MPENPTYEESFYQGRLNSFQRLRKLQDLTRSTVPALMAERPAFSFTLQPEPIAQDIKKDVVVVVYPQDPFVGEPEVRRMNAADIQPGLVNSRIRIRSDESEPVQPDKDGNYMYWPGTPQFAQVNSFYYVNYTLRMYERYASRQIPWAFPSPRISVDPHVGEDANAFYSEQDRLLGFHSFKVGDDIVSTAHSADIVSHETAHAILDGLRDFHNESFGLGTTAFHESFGDISAVLVALHDDSLVRRLLDWTKGDLHVDNFITAVAEQMTNQLLEHQTQYVRGHTVYLRNALNNLIYRPFDDLLYTANNPQQELGREPHNYSRLFTGAFYDVLVGIYDRLRKEMPAHIALHRARDIVGGMLVCAVELGPIGELDFSDMALAFLSAEAVLCEGKYRDILIDIFCTKRSFLTREAAGTRIQHLENLPEIKLPSVLDSPLASSEFLETKILPALKIAPDSELLPLSTYRNGDGFAYLNYFSTQQITLTGEEYKDFNGAKMDVFGGLTLMFDRKNRLRSVYYRPVTPEDIRQLRRLVAELISFGMVASTQPTAELEVNYPLYAQPSTTQGLALPLSQTPQPEITKLVKFPVIFDDVPQPPPLLDYLRVWGRQHDLK